VAKEQEQGRTHSSFSLLAEEERVDELARMLAGESVSSQTRAWAVELLAKGANGQSPGKGQDDRATLCR
jgi:DNA repair protein RecN (Recombination protein N)